MCELLVYTVVTLHILIGQRDNYMSRKFLLVTRECSYTHSDGRVLIPIDKIIQIEETDEHKTRILYFIDEEIVRIVTQEPFINVVRGTYIIKL